MFNKSFDRVFDNEGGFTDHKADRGNWTGGQVGEGECRGTKYGISAMSYPNLIIKDLTKDQAKVIYRRDFWDKLGLESLPKAIQYQVFDAAVNHGLKKAIELMQSSVGVKPDGVAGPVTLKAVHAMDHNDLLMCFLAERLVFLTMIGTFGTFGKGWVRRVAHNLKYATEDN